MTLTSAQATADPAAADPPVPAGTAWLVLIGGALGLIASVTLTVEKIRLLADPSYVPSCNLNPVLSCGSVMTTEQASVLAVPNSLIGIVAFTVATVTGLLAVTKVPLPRWYWAGLAVGLAVGAGFVHWLIFVSLHQIGTLCPYCMLVWLVTVPLLVAVASVALAPARAHPVYRWRWTLTALWFIALILLIFLRFDDYWSSLV